MVEANAVVGQLLSVGEVTATLYPLDFGIVEIQVPIRVLKQLDAGIGRIELRPVHDPDADPACLLYTSPSPRDVEESRMPSSA